MGKFLRKAKGFLFAVVLCLLFAALTVADWFKKAGSFLKKASVGIIKAFVWIKKAIEWVLYPLFWILSKLFNIIRPTIVKLYALNHFSKFFGMYVSYTRSAPITYTLFSLTGWVIIYGDINGVDLTALKCVLYTLIGLSLFLGFKYFELEPVKFNELDCTQKYFYGEAFLKDVVNPENDSTFDMEKLLSCTQFTRWAIDNKRFHKPILFLWHPIAALFINILIYLTFFLW